MLIPNNKQNTKLFRYANTARFAYNWALGREKENYKNGGKFLNKRSKMLVMHIRDFSKDVQSFRNSKAENFLYHLFIKIM